MNTIVVIDDLFNETISLNDEFKKLNCNLVVVSNYQEALQYLDFNLVDLLVVTQTDIENIKIKDYTKFELFDILKKPYSWEELIIRVELFLVKKQFHEFERNSYRNLLEQYKNTIDKSTIVSKTDPQGVITYVNEEFCSISGYAKEELIGKPHNIVRHPDMPKSDFEWMWYTIKNLKQIWRGEVKNLKKDGGVYWVQAIICPMFDDCGEIVEYISVRTDITQQKTVVSYLEGQLQITTSNFEDAIQLKQEYERAIDLSNILSRTDKNGRIIYVNDEFCRTFGYTKDEVLGQTHKIISSNEMTKEFYKNLWSVITQGETYRQIFKNKAKNGDFVWTDTTIVPIKNKNHEIIEYMAIKHNITQVFELNQEIEDTQREIIFKMAEIGESRSKETGNHVKRVAEYSKLLAILYGLSDDEAHILFIASPMHDIGKVGIPDRILNKDGKLSDEEYLIMKTHTEIGYEVLKGSSRDVLNAASIVAYEHHEKYDGSGYPRGLKGDDIHIYGRITALADAFDALDSDRCYKKAWEIDRILAFFNTEKGKHFDPKLIDLFIENLDKFLEIRNRLKD